MFVLDQRHGAMPDHRDVTATSSFFEPLSAPPISASKRNRLQ
jgi:hypothetical protein